MKHLAILSRQQSALGTAQALQSGYNDQSSLAKGPNHFKIVLVILSILTTTFSCTPDARLERREDKLQGAWEFDKAFYRSDWDLFRDDVMDDFRGDIIEFYGDYSAVYDDASENTFFDGEWNMFYECEWDYVDDDEEVEFYLDMYFYDDDDREIFAYYTSVNLITQNKLHLKAHTRDGVYTFKLRKL